MVPSFEKLRRIPDNTHGILSTLVVAAGTAGAGVAVLRLTKLPFGSLSCDSRRTPFQFFVIGSLVVISLTSTATGLLMQNVFPKFAGSGVPELKAACWKDLGFLQTRSVIVKSLVESSGWVAEQASGVKDSPFVSMEESLRTSQRLSAIRRQAADCRGQRHGRFAGRGLQHTAGGDKVRSRENAQ